MADEQFHFANNKWDIKNLKKNKNKKTRENKQRKKLNCDYVSKHGA